jgi:flagellar hook-associated protein 3 FlgL
MSGWGAIFNNVSYALSVQTEQLLRLQEQSSSGSRVNRASDDPADAYTILHLREQQARTAAYAKNLDSVETSLQTCDTALQGTSSVLLQAQQVLSQASSGTYTADQLVSMGEGLNSFLEQALAMANTQGAGGYVFGGDQTRSAPYQAQRDSSGRIVSVSYQGSDSARAVPVAAGIQQYGQLVGADVFGADQRQAPVFLGATGAKAGTGTSSARGDVWLTVAHATTTYDAGSQLSAGLDSAAGDTILGTHKVTISAAQKTIQLDDGPVVTFTGSETNLALQNASGQTAYVNVAGWTTADGQFNLQAGGSLSIDGGVTKTALSLSDNLAVTDPRTGQVLYVDARGIDKVGQEPVSVPGTHDVMGLLIELRNTLENKAGLSTAQQTQLMQEANDSLKEVLAQTTRYDTAVGGRLKAVDTLRSSLTSTGALAKQQADSLQNADITQVSVDLAREQNLYQMTLASAAKLLNVSLLDYMQ